MSPRDSSQVIMVERYFMFFDHWKIILFAKQLRITWNPDKYDQNNFQHTVLFLTYEIHQDSPSNFKKHDQ